MSTYESEGAFERFMDDLQVLYSLKAGQTVTQADVDALNRVEKHYRTEDERATDAYHRGWNEGLAHAATADVVALTEKLKARELDLTVERTMATLARTQANRFEVACRAAYRFISQPTLMRSPAGGPKTATYRVERYNELTALLRDALGSRLTDGSAEGVAPVIASEDSREGQ